MTPDLSLLRSLSPAERWLVRVPAMHTISSPAWVRQGETWAYLERPEVLRH
jgi:hypothetical protein